MAEESNNTNNARIPVTMFVTGVEYAPGVENQVQRNEAEKRKREADDVRDDGLSKLNRIIGTLNLDTSLISDSDKRKDAEITKFLGEQFDKISDVMTKGVGMAFGVVEDIYKELKKSSPLLQTLETLFNLAMQLFFMPLGNKLAEVLLPAVIQLVETMADMWDELGDGNLESMFSKAIAWGINALATFFKNIGDSLSTQGGLLGSLGKIMTAIGNFIEGPMLDIIQFILDAVGFVIDNLKHIIAAIVAFKVASLAMDLITMHVIIAANTSAHGYSIGVPAALALATTATAYLGAEAALSSLGMADGGIVKHTPGGRLITVGENEDEYIIPKSKMGNGGNVTNNFYGYTSDDIREMIDRSVSDKISASHIRGGY